MVDSDDRDEGGKVVARRIRFQGAQLMTRGSWTYAGFGVAAVAIAVAAWALVADADRVPREPIDVVGPSKPGTTTAGGDLTARPIGPVGAAPITPRAAEAVPMAGPPSEWPQLKGIAFDVATERPVGAFTYWIVAHDGSDPVARLAGQPAVRHKAPSGIFRSRQRPGRYDVVIEAAGYLRCVRTNIEVPNPSRKPLGFALETGAGIAGLVYTEQGMPAPDVAVFLHVQRLSEGSETPRVSAARTAADGTFQFTPLDPGQYAISLLEPDNRRDRLAAIYVEDRVTKVDLTLATRHQLTLQLRDDAGRPVPEARIELVGDGRIAKAVATKGGLAVLEHVDDGSYSLRISRDGFEPYVEDLELSGGFGQTMRWIGLSRSTPR